MHSTEKRVADAILQRSQKVTICGHTYEVAPPTPATLIMASEYIAELPKIDVKGNLVATVLSCAKDAKALGKVVATLILGAKRINQNRKIRVGLFKKRSELEWMSQYLMENMTTRELASVITERLADMQIGDFFGLTTSLAGASLTRPTKEVETAFGE